MSQDSAWLLSGRQLAEHLVTCESRAVLELPGVGRLTVRRYEAYTGRHPRTGEVAEVAAKRVVSFRADPALRHELGDALSMEDEEQRRARETERVLRFEWSDSLAGELRARLIEHGSAELPAVGRFTLERKPARSELRPAKVTVRVEPNDELRRRLADCASPGDHQPGRGSAA